ncbi:NACHT domain-containing protein [Candidatus Gracilibacteria bacterium]|nr:NACHT domain-containing protein [Candidatus Gracilibacteria bacterium]
MCGACRSPRGSGRANEYKALLARLRAPETRLLTIVGPGGFGKTRLALQVAADLRAEYNGAVLMLTFAGVENGEAALSAMATALAVPLHGAAPLISRVVAALDAAPILLLLDNLEHLVGEALLVELLSTLVRNAPHVRLLVASREQLRLSGERVFDLGGLGLPTATDSRLSDAMLLFLDRAQRLDSDFALTAQNQAAVAQLCRLLEGSPLAIELAAAWVSTLSPPRSSPRSGAASIFLCSPTRYARTAPLHARGLRAFLATAIARGADGVDAPGRVSRRLHTRSGAFCSARWPAAAGEPDPEIAAAAQRRALGAARADPLLQRRAAACHSCLRRNSPPSPRLLTGVGRRGLRRVQSLGRCALARNSRRRDR